MSTVIPTLPTNASPTRYTGRDYVSAVQEISNFVRSTNSTVWSDFYESNLGQVVVELCANVIDVTSWGTDAAFLETFLATANRYQSGYYFALSVGYTPRQYTAASAILTSQGTPQSVFSFGCVIPAGSVIQGQNGLAYTTSIDTVVLPGTNIITLEVTEGSSAAETYSPSNIPNQIVSSVQGQVAQDSWTVYVGDPNNPNNQWTQVPSVLNLTSQSQSYDVSFDTNGILNVRFGDGVSGAIPQNTVTLQYATCNGSRGNAPAGSISGSLLAAVPAPTATSASIPFANYAASVASAGQPVQALRENHGPSTFSTVQLFALGNTPLQPGTVVITLNFGGIQVITVQDDGAGAFNTITNTSGTNSLTVGAVNYSGGSITLTFAQALTAGLDIWCDYTYVVGYNPASATITGAATGGGDAETLDDLRINVPAFIRNSGRLITYQDYTDAPRAVGGIAASRAQALSSEYSGNVVYLYCWAAQSVNFSSTEPGGTFGLAAYTRYSQIDDTLVSAVQQYIRPRSLLTIHNIIQKPLMTWVDVYLGQVRVDSRVNAQTIRQGIVDAVVGYFQGETGFEVRVGPLSAAISAVIGVTSFNILRLVTGSRYQTSTVDVMPPSIGGSYSATGTMVDTPISPGSVAITIALNNGTTILLVDDGVGHIIIAAADQSGYEVSSGSIDYATGIWTVTFTATLLTGTVTATYSDVVADYRLNQVVVAGVDPWPVAPSGDGLPLSVSGSGPTAIETYAPMQDLVIESINYNSYFFDYSIPFADLVAYDSVNIADVNVTIFNLRKLSFQLVSQ